MFDNPVLDGNDRRVPMVATGIDSLGHSLPAGFDTYAETYGYTGDDLTTIVRTGPAGTYTQTLSYTNGKLTGATRWVKA